MYVKTKIVEFDIIPVDIKAPKCVAIPAKEWHGLKFTRKYHIQWPGYECSHAPAKIVWLKHTNSASYDDVIKWKHFPRYWPFVRESTGHRWIPLTKASDAELRCFLWSAPQQMVWVNNKDAGELWRNRSHYYVTVLNSIRNINAMLAGNLDHNVKYGKISPIPNAPTIMIGRTSPRIGLSSVLRMSNTRDRTSK